MSTSEGASPELFLFPGNTNPDTIEDHPLTSALERKGERFGLCTPIDINEIFEHKAFNEGIYNTYLHEIGHVRVAASFASDIESGLELTRLVKATPGVDKKGSTYKGYAVISNSIGIGNLATVAMAGAIDPPGAVAEGYQSDESYAAKISRMRGIGSTDSHKEAAREIMDDKNSDFTDELHVELAARATYMQVVHRAEAITPKMLNTMYKQAILAIKAREEGFDPKKIAFYDQNLLSDYLNEAAEINRAYEENGEQSLGGWEIITDVVVLKDKPGFKCSQCGHWYIAGMTCLNCSSH